MTPRERVLSAFKFKQTDKVPFCQLDISLKLAKEITCSEKDLTEHEMSILFRRDNVNYWGVMPPVFVDEVYDREDNNYRLEGKIKSNDDLSLLVFPNINSEFLKPARDFIHQKGDHAANAVISFGLEPTIKSIGYNRFSRALVDDTDFVLEVFNRYIKWVGELVKKLSGLGFDFLWVMDDIALKSGPVFQPKIFAKFFLPMLRSVSRNISIPWIFFSRGNLMPIINNLLSLEMDGLHFVESYAMDMYRFKEDYGDKVCIVGGIDNELLVTGKPSEIENETKVKLQKMSDRGFILSTTGNIADEMGMDNLTVFINAIDKYGKIEA